MITMSQKELGRLRVVERVLQGGLGYAEAASVLQMSARQFRRIVRRYEAGGAQALAHGLRGRASNRKIPQALALQVQQLIAAHYADFGPTLAAEMLRERHGIGLSVESVRALIQIDGSQHDWFEGRGPRCTLLVFIDDATSELMALRFAPDEGLGGAHAAQTLPNLVSKRSRSKLVRRRELLFSNKPMALEATGPSKLSTRSSLD